MSVSAENRSPLKLFSDICLSPERAEVSHRMLYLCPVNHFVRALHSHNLICSGAGLNVRPVINMAKYSIMCVS